MSQQEKKIKLDGELSLTVDGQRFGNTSHIHLLAKIAELGSITRAAKAVEMSYKAAWDAIDNMNRLAETPLVERTSGGRGGGGTRLTARGEELVKNFSLIEREHKNFIKRLSNLSQSLADDLPPLQKMRLKTSARNQLLCEIVSIKSGNAMIDEVTLEIKGTGQTIIATITPESSKILGLIPGLQLFALIKASAVMIKAPDVPLKSQYDSQIYGKIITLKPGAINSEIEIELPGGTVIASVLSSNYLKRHQLKVGSDIAGIIDPSNIILGLSCD